MSWLDSWEGFGKSCKKITEVTGKKMKTKEKAAPAIIYLNLVLNGMKREIFLRLPRLFVGTLKRGSIAKLSSGLGILGSLTLGKWKLGKWTLGRSTSNFGTTILTFGSSRLISGTLIWDFLPLFTFRFGRWNLGKIRDTLELKVSGKNQKFRESRSKV